MIFDAVEQCWLMTNDWFPVDMAMLANLVNLPGLQTTATVVKRQSVERMKQEGLTPPILGIVALQCQTQAKDQGKRDSLVTIQWDYYAEAANAAAVVTTDKQVELAVEAILYTIDRLAGSGLKVFEAGGLPGSVTVVLTEGVTEGEAPTYWRRATVTAPLWDRDDVV